MIIRRILDSEEEQYDQLAKEYGTIFYTVEWLKIFGNAVQIFGIYDKSGKLIGGFYLYLEKKYGLTICRQAPFTPSNGPFLKVAASNPVAIMDLWKKALNLMAEYIEQLSYSIVSIALDRNIIDAQPFIWRSNKAVVRYTYLLDLDQTIDIISKNMSAERRNDLRKGERDGLIAKQVEDCSDIKSLILKTFHRQSVEINQRLLEQLLFRFLNNNSFAVTTYYNGSPIAAAYCVYDGKAAYYLFGGYDHENKHHGAGALALWHAIKHAKSLGLKKFDFEGSMVPQIEKYFRGFGGKLTPYYRINKAYLPIEIILKLFKRELF